jgi:hypothetical protein
MKSRIFNIVNDDYIRQGEYGKIVHDIYEEGDAREIISIEGSHLVAVVIIWKSGDLSFDLLSKYIEGSQMRNTSHFEYKDQNENKVFAFLQEFKLLDSKYNDRELS